LDGCRSAWKRDGSGHAISRWLPEGTEDDVATKPVPAGCFARGQRAWSRGAAWRSVTWQWGRKYPAGVPGWARRENLHRDGIRRSAS